MVAITTRESYGAELPWQVVDANFISLATAIDNIGEDVLAEAVVAKDAAVLAATASQSAAASANASSISAAASVTALAESDGATKVGNGGETVAQSFSSLQLANYAAVRAYTGPRNLIYVTDPGAAGAFIRLPSGVDDNAITLVTSGGIVYGRVSSGPVDARWWLAKFDNVADDSSAMQACIDYAQPKQKQILCPEGIAKITTRLSIAFSLFGLNMLGAGWQKTRFNYSSISPSTDACIYITGHSGTQCGAVIEGIGFDGAANSVAIVIAGQDGQFVRRCQFAENAYGVIFRNSVSGSFSEYNVCEYCDFTAACSTPLWYNVAGSGDVSFHGSGMRFCTVNTPHTPAYRVVRVDPTAFPYNSPMDIQVWGNAAGVVIDMASYGSGRPYFTGTITTEAFTPGMVLCNAPVGKEVPLVGRIAGVSSGFSRGSLFTVDAVIDDISGSRQTIGGKLSKLQNLTTGANTITGIPTCMTEGGVQYSINIVGPNYNYRYLVGAFSKENSGLAPILATFSTFNSAGWGAPSFSLDETTGALIITNASYPASGVFVQIDAVQFAQSIYAPFFV